MRKNKNLINKKEVTKIIKLSGIKRVSPEFLEELKKITSESINRMINKAVEEAKASGRRTLKKEDLVFQLQKDKDYPEI